MKYKIVFSYDGSAFLGYAKQPNLKTIQGELEKNLSLILNQTIILSASGRTDKGVHALNQVASFNVSKVILNKDKFLHSINKLLNEEIYVKKLVKVSESFDARFSAKKKEYRYYINLGEFNPLLRKYELFINNKDFDVNRFIDGSKIFIGEHNFINFCSKDEDKDGILVIYVYKGEDTPYIANGTVYIRSGSSKVPITSDRATIDTLYRRNENLQQRKEEFSSTNMDIDYDGGPLLEIYMFNRDNMNIELYKNSIDRQNLIEIKSKIVDVAPDSIVYPSVDSIIIKNNDLTNISTTTLYIEIYNNSNVKIHIPIFMFGEDDKEQFEYNISKFNNNTYEDLEYYSFIDAYILWKSIYGSISGIYEILKGNNINFNDYEYLLDFNNIKDSIFYINNKEFLEHIKKNGLPIVKHNNYRTKYIYIIESVEDALHIASKLFFQIVGKMWGYCPNELIMIMKKLIEKNR